METLKVDAIIDQNGRLRLDVSTTLPAGGVEVIIVLNHQQAFNESTKHKSSKYDFSDLIGKLTWQGDAVSTQRALRDEW
jgi:hypothetical protein